ncbi:energy-coupling factor ABC transporter permease [Methanobrevibacter sp. AbM4]|uniref:energy-coupling factor ABC transporter permease n=1 Tax=Methanobrevibacter sp. AbM4 TaxID=224719 RepID=UPI0003348891|nr:energy-coupling factor ABC transporter permease [Methanobrevibacter sp. AbM4]AGN16641.1 cobalamin biosynthesis protein CbiM2 [Methanobrevibacter sp. AbM4]
MHIMEGFLPPMWCLIWYIIMIPIVGYGIYQIKKITEEYPDTKALLAVSGAFMFVLSSLKMPSVTGSCSHPCGNGLGVALFGPAITGVLGTIVLIFQALLLAHGGITTLGANCLSMGIIGPFCGWVVYKACQKVGVNTKVNIFLTAFVADIMTYFVTSVELALAFPVPSFASAFAKFFIIFMPTQIPLGIAEGLLTVIIWNGLLSYKPELLEKLNVINPQDVPSGDD